MQNNQLTILMNKVTDNRIMHNDVSFGAAVVYWYKSTRYSMVPSFSQTLTPNHFSGAKFYNTPSASRNKFRNAS